MADSTIILQDFDATKIMGGAYGHLQQEFRGLEILDYISSKLKYDGDLPDSINGHCHNVLSVYSLSLNLRPGSGLKALIKV